MFLVTIAPSAPRNVIAFNVSSTSINVMWQPPMTPNGIVRSYRVVYTTGSTTANINTTNVSIVITMLEIFTNYQVQVFATTVTEGNGSNVVMVTTDEDSKSWIIGCKLFLGTLYITSYF